MKDVVEEFVRTVEEASARLLSMTEAEVSSRRGEGSWSAKETLGHLIDSAANNHQRFVRAQFKEDLIFPGYAQDEWVRSQGYNDEPWPLVVNLWKFYNLHLAHILLIPLLPTPPSSNAATISPGSAPRSLKLANDD